MGGWRPIADAPKGVLIDIWMPHEGGGGQRWADCYYDGICGQWRTISPSGHLAYVPECAVTHWMYPPIPPAAERPRHDGALEGAAT